MRLVPVLGVAGLDHQRHGQGHGRFGGALHEITDIIASDSFYVGKHADIFKIMLELSSKGDPIDLLSVSQKASEKGLIDAIGGSNYLAELTNSVPASTNVKHYADIMERKSILRNIIEAGGDITEMGFKEEIEDVYEVLDHAEKRMMNIASPMRAWISLPSTKANKRSGPLTLRNSASASSAGATGAVG